MVSKLLKQQETVYSVRWLAKTNYKTVKYGVLQGSILGPLLFLLNINHLQFTSDLLDPVMFDDDTNLSYSNKDINNSEKI